MKNKIIIKSQNILSFDQQVKENKKIHHLSLDQFFGEYFRIKITPPRYLYFTK
jgi:hypothetical protein